MEDRGRRGDADHAVARGRVGQGRRTPGELTPGTRSASVLFAIVLVALCALAPTRIMGDGPEYIAVARQLAGFHGPSLPADTPIPLLPLDRYGRRQVWHFWFFPALAVPLLWMAPAQPALAFTCLNIALLTAAFAVVYRRAGPAAAVAICAGPVLWWVDKTQVEVFMVALLAIGCALLDRRERAAVAFAFASTQNPPVASLVILLAAERLLRRPRALMEHRGWWLTAFAVSALHPAYYLWRLGMLTPLGRGGDDVRIPDLRMLMAVVTDANLGLAPNAPFTALVLAVVAIAAAARKTERRRLLFAGAAAGAFLFAFAFTTNFNAGGTPDMSRQGLWLVPLGVAIWPRGPVTRGLRVAIASLVAASAAWSAIYYRPSVRENYLDPTRFALWVWTNHPSWENPLPEVFAERLRHREGVNPLAATPDCSKALLQDGVWPTGCPQRRVSAECAVEGMLCYANRSGAASYRFVPTERLGGIRLRRRAP